MRATSIEELQDLVSNSVCISEVCRKLGIKPKGGNWECVKSRIKKFGIDTSHFLGKSSHCGPRQTGKCHKQNADEILTIGKIYREKAHKLRRALNELGVPFQCNICGIPGTYMGKPLMLDVDHINGDWTDCRKENLQYLCPNCHSQTTSFRKQK